MGAEQPFPVQAGTGWSRKRMKFANEATSEGTMVGSGDSNRVRSSGVGLKMQPGGIGLGGYPRSFGKSSFVTPISTLYASPAKMSRDLFWAFQPNRVME